MTYKTSNTEEAERLQKEGKLLSHISSTTPQEFTFEVEEEPVRQPEKVVDQIKTIKKTSKRDGKGRFKRAK